MSVRTTSDAVKSILRDKGDYGPLPDGTDPSLDPYIDSASVVIDRVVACAARKRITIGSEEAEIIERWLSAHLYAVSDRPVQSESKGRGSHSLQGQTGMGFEFTGYGQQAMSIDPSGCLRTLNKGGRVGGGWLGKNKPDRRTWTERN
jgi:hypothetical protein